MKKLLTTALASTAMALAAPASAIIVGGIDFGAQGNLSHLETATLAQSYVDSLGQSFRAYGVISTVNGDSTYCADGSANCALYYVARNYTVSGVAGAGNAQEFRFTGGVVDVYYASAAQVNLTLQSSVANLAFIQGLTPWVSLTGHGSSFLGAAANETLIGTGRLTGTGSLTGTGEGLLDVASGFGIASVRQYLDTNTLPDFANGSADIAITSSFNTFVINANDTCSLSATSGPRVGEWCYQGTSNLRGRTNPVSEPGSLALMGVMLSGLGWMTRRRRSK